MSKLLLLWDDFCIFLANIEMWVVRKLHPEYFLNLSEEDIPKNTFYCYGGCRCLGEKCPYMDYPLIYKLLAGHTGKYCHYVKGGLDDCLLWDDCKICGIHEPGDDEIEYEGNDG